MIVERAALSGISSDYSYRGGFTMNLADKIDWLAIAAIVLPSIFVILVAAFLSVA